MPCCGCGSPSSGCPACCWCWPATAGCAACRTPGRRSGSCCWPTLLSAVASPLLVFPAGLGLAGSAIANVGAQWLARRAVRAGDPGRAGAAVARSGTVIRAQLVVSRDLVLRSVAFQAAFMVAAGVAGRLGSAQLAAHQIGLQLWEFVALLLDSFAIAAQSLVGAALGGGDVGGGPAHRLAGQRATAWRPACCSRRCWPPAGSLSRRCSAPIRRCSSRRTCSGRGWSAMQPVGGIVFALDGVLLGAGDNAMVRTITLCRCRVGLHPAVPAEPAVALGDRRGVGRAGGLHRAPAGRDELADPDRSLAGGRASSADRPIQQRALGPRLPAGDTLAGWRGRVRPGRAV